MAIIWSYVDPVSQTHYEVRSAGFSLRLYTNGAFHSQFSPKHLFTGAVWDLLSIPVMLRSGTRVPYSNSSNGKGNILVLGVGGGTVIHQLNRLTNPKKITGIEINPVHIQVARNYFGLNADNTHLVEADAFTWVNRSRRKFDVIVDDLFVDAPEDPVRPFEPNHAWLTKLERRLTSRGVLIQNHLTKKSAMLAGSKTENFRTALLFTTPRYQNVILALYREMVDVKPAVARMKQTIHAIDPRALGKLKFDIKKVY